MLIFIVAAPIVMSNNYAQMFSFSTLLLVIFFCLLNDSKSTGPNDSTTLALIPSILYCSWSLPRVISEHKDKNKSWVPLDMSQNWKIKTLTILIDTRSHIIIDLICISLHFYMPFDCILSVCGEREGGSWFSRLRYHL